MVDNTTTNVSSLIDDDSNNSTLLRAGAKVLLSSSVVNDTETSTSSTPMIHLRSLFTRFTGDFMDTVAWAWAEVSPYITWPLILVFVLPLVICFFIYLSAFVLYLHQKGFWKSYNRIREALIEEGDLAKAGREVIATIWDFQGWIWFGYEVQGLENIPVEGPALIYYYHGALPIDYYYLVAKIVLLKQRAIHSVVDRFLFKIPGMSTFLRVFNCTMGTVESCTEELNEGHLLGISPGGVYESQFSDQNYNIEWKNRLGFARIALSAGVPVIPVFTQNIREAFRTVGAFRWIVEPIYNRFRIPCMPMYGGFPVKLVTHIGEAFKLDPELSPEEARDKCREALQELIDAHQQKPGNIFRAFYQRFGKDRAHEL